MCVVSAHSVSRSLLSVERLGDVKDPRVPTDHENPLGSLIGTWSADLVAHGHFVLIAGLNLKENFASDGPAEANPLWEKHRCTFYLHHQFRIWTSEIFRQVNGWNDPLPLHPPPGAGGELALSIRSPAQSSKLSPRGPVLSSYLDLFASWFTDFRTAPKFCRGLEGETLRHLEDSCWEDRNQTGACGTF